jgi:hypothetical protein
MCIRRGRPAKQAAELDHLFVVVLGGTAMMGVELADWPTGHRIPQTPIRTASCFIVIPSEVGRTL